MAERRMFAKTVIDSDAFLDMPLSTQALYFHLSMRADDDGFINNPKKIQRMVGCGDDDLKLLIAKSFIIPFESGIVVIKHWKIHNYIRSDRYKPTVYAEEKAILQEKENGAYTLGIPCGIPTGIPTVDHLDTQDRIGQVRLIQDSIEGGEINNIVDVEPLPSPKEKTDYQSVVDLYHSICSSFPSVRSLSDARKKAIKARLNTYTIDDFKTLFEKAEASDFLKGSNSRNWSANFDWLIKDSNMAKVLDGNYDNRISQTKTGRKEPVPAWIAGEAELEGMRKLHAERKNILNDPKLAARAEALKKQLGGDPK